VELTWYGMSCFRMVERGLATVVTDPFDASVGLPAPKLRADVITISHDAPGHNNLAAVKGERRVIQDPGEYEIGGVFITGIAMNSSPDNKNGGRANTLYVFDFDGLVVETESVILALWQAEFERHGVEFPVDAHHPAQGGGDMQEPP